VLSLVEPKENFDRKTDKWGHEPLRDISQGHYGLGLNRARTIIESHGGKLEAHYDQAGKNLITTITIPASPKRE
jgi:signal transduction histidine kinase